MSELRRPIVGLSMSIGRAQAIYARDLELDSQPEHFLTQLEKLSIRIVISRPSSIEGCRKHRNISEKNITALL